MSSVTGVVDLSGVLGDLATLKADTDTLKTRLSSARAGYLDRLDTTISSRSTQVSQNTAQTSLNTLSSRLTSARAANLDNLNATISSRSSQTSVNAIPTSPVASVQSGYEGFINDSGGFSGEYYFDLSISAVNVAKSVVHADQAMRSGDNSLAAYLLNSTTIRFYYHTAQLQNVTWEVIEYA